MENIFITITGISHYYGKKPFEIGRTVKLIKEPDNPYDNEAVGVYLPFIDKIGNVANSVNTVYSGTQSAGRIWDKIENEAFAQIMFVTHSSAIALILPPDPENNKESPETDTNKISTAENLPHPPRKTALVQNRFLTNQKIKQNQYILIELFVDYKYLLLNCKAVKLQMLTAFQSTKTI